MYELSFVIGMVEAEVVEKLVARFGTNMFKRVPKAK